MLSFSLPVYQMMHWGKIIADISVCPRAAACMEVIDML